MGSAGDGLQPYKPGERATDEFWQDAWNFDTEAMRQLLNLTEKASLGQSYNRNAGGEAANQTRGRHREYRGRF